MTASPASADFDSSIYSHAGSGCNNRVDPISLVMYGYGAYYSLARAKMEHVLNVYRGPWNGTDGASQYASSHGFCTPMDGNSYDACSLCNRNHVRLNQTHHKDGLGRYETVGTPHFDEVVIYWRGRYLHFASTRPGTEPARPLASSERMDATGVNLPEALLYLQTNREDTWLRLQSIMEDILPEVGKLVVRTRDHVLAGFIDPATGRELNLKNLGTGVEQLLLAAYAGIAHPPGGMVIIEEPESSLHPAAQRQLLGHLRNWAQDRTIVISTHSPLLLDQAGPAVWVVRRREGISSLAKSDAGAPEALAELGVRLSDVLSAERILLVEGASDQDVIDTWFGAQLEAAGAVILPIRGSDASWQLPTVEAAFAAADELGRKLLLVRDRDELSDATLQQLRAKASMWVLERRELENYLLDPAAIAAVLADQGVDVPDPEQIRELLVRAADERRLAVVLRRAAARFAVIRLFDRNWLEDALPNSSLAVMEERVPTALPSREEVVASVRAAWEDEEHWVAGRWEHDKLALCPGAELLSAVWQEYGLRYRKRRDGPRLAQRIAPAADLENAIDRLLSD